VFELRAYGDSAAIEAVSTRLSALAGVRHLTVGEAAPGATAPVAADVSADAADTVLAILEQQGLPPDDIVLTRLETISTAPQGVEPFALVWADVLGQASARAGAPGRYLALMAAAGVVAAFAIVNRSSVLIVGAMAISPDLLPITAACTGFALGRPGLVRRGLGSLFAGLAVVGMIAASIAALLDAFGLLPSGFSLGEIPAAQTHIGASTIPIALAAGAAGVLALETRASAAVGVAISVTTIPAIAYLGVGLGTGHFDKSLSAFWVLLANVAMMVVGGTSTLAGQRLMVLRGASRP
jgi:uncharacterized hydrophobic protein (TIGR00271 family)